MVRMYECVCGVWYVTYMFIHLLKVELVHQYVNVVGIVSPDNYRVSVRVCVCVCVCVCATYQHTRDSSGHCTSASHAMGNRNHWL